MKQTIEKPIAVNSDLDELKATIQEYHSFLENARLKNELIKTLEHNLDEVNQDIQDTQSKMDITNYPKMRNVADVDEFMRNFGAPHKRLELLLKAKEDITNQIVAAQSDNSRYIVLEIGIKHDAWRKLAKILLKPIQFELNQTLFAIRQSGDDLLKFLFTENEGIDMSELGSNLTSKYGMPQ